MTATASQELETPVLIVGGGPVGLTLALDLAIRGVRSILVERDAGTAVELLAKAGTLNERTMEYCRWLGISDAIANVGFPDDHPRDTVYCTALNGFVLGRDYRPSTNDRAATAPSGTQAAAAASLPGTGSPQSSGTTTVKSRMTKW